MAVTQAWFRVGGGCQDTDNNENDFVAGTVYPNARSLATPLTPCGPAADVTVSVSESVDPVETNGTVTYTVTASNIGTAAASNTVLTVVLSGSAYPGSISNISQGACAFTSPTLTCTVGSLAISASFVVTFDVVPLIPGSIAVNANVSSDLPETGGNNAASATTTATVAPGNPTSFLLLSPGDDEILRLDTTSFTWTDSPGAVIYDVTLINLSSNTRVGEQYDLTVNPLSVCVAGICSLPSSTLIPAGLEQGKYAWTVVAGGNYELEATNGANVFTVVLDDSLDLVGNGGFEESLTLWTKQGLSGRTKRVCGAAGAGSNCAVQLKSGGGLIQRSMMEGILSRVETSAGDVIRISAMAWSNKPTLNKAVVVVVKYATPTAGAGGNGKDKFVLAMTGVTTSYAEYSSQYALADTIVKGTVALNFKPATGKARFDDVSVTLMPIGTVPRANVRGVLPPPAAPDGFRGNN